ncbi:hypothetical protein [Povalibacter sp.]|uniref:hypothetical protein n=1 Tax=Povalibacter sp. TaxID=1962978 RepID=UPI002F409323
MSDDWLQLVPNDPQFQPDRERAESARQLLASLVPEADEVTAEDKDGIEFIHPGSNWSGVQCSACGADAESWWEEALDSAEAGEFRNLQCVASCCGADVSLNDLRYIWPAAFGRFVLSAMNPNIEDFPADQKHELEQRLGCTLRVVWTHL